MTTFSAARTYRMSGTVMEVCGNHFPILDAIHARLQWAATEREVEPHLRVRVDLVQQLPDWRNETKGCRVVLDHPQAQIWYDVALDRMLASFGDEGAALVDGPSLSAELFVRRNGGREDWMGSHPLFTPALTDLFKRRGLHNLHAAGAAIQGRAILIAGASGSGKSTLSIALARRGFDFLGDDRIFLEEGDEGLELLPFPDDIDLRDGTPGLFEELRPILDTPKPEGWPKWKLSAAEFYSAVVPAKCRPGLLVFPTISQSDQSELMEISAHEALLELVPNVVLTEAASTQAHLNALSALTQKSRCYRLKTGRDFDHLAEQFREQLLQLAHGTTA